MAHICQVHPYEVAEGLCRSCGGPFCADCLVYPFGPVKPPYCVPCAVSAAGVRTTARNPTVVVPKETKRRLKEWRKARKRDLDSPPPDGVATWQKMDEAAAADEEDSATAEASAEREALRLPPPQPETPTPPPGVNLAPPGPRGTDWRDEIAVPTHTSGPAGVEGAAAAPPPIAGESALGAGWAGDDLGSSTEPDRLPPVATPLPADDPYGAEPPVTEPRPYTERSTTYAGPAADRPPDQPAAFADSAFAATSAAPPPAEPPGPEPAPFSLVLDDASTDAFGPRPSGDSTTGFTDTFGPTPTIGDATPGADHGFAGAFAPTPFEPALDTTPLTVELTGDPLASFGLGRGAVPDPLPPPPANGGHAFEPLSPPPPDRQADASAALSPPVVHADPPPPAPVVPPPREPVVAPHTRTAAAPATPRLTPPPAPTRHVAPGVPRSAIRPPTPTRIPAAEPEAPKTNDAKAMLARIAALRSDKTDQRPPA